LLPVHILNEAYNNNNNNNNNNNINNNNNNNFRMFSRSSDLLQANIKYIINTKEMTKEKTKITKRIVIIPTKGNISSMEKYIPLQNTQKKSRHTALAGLAHFAE
jgi:hypothetical protein